MTDVIDFGAARLRRHLGISAAEILDRAGKEWSAHARHAAAYRIIHLEWLLRRRREQLRVGSYARGPRKGTPLDARTRWRKVGEAKQLEKQIALQRKLLRRLAFMAECHA